MRRIAVRGFHPAVLTFPLVNSHSLSASLAFALPAAALLLPFIAFLTTRLLTAAFTVLLHSFRTFCGIDFLLAIKMP